MNIYKSTTELDWGCGVTVVGNFQRDNAYWQTDIQDLTTFNSSTGFFISSFINNRICQEAYKFIKENFQIVYQSPVKVNTNSNKKFFFIVYRKK